MKSYRVVIGGILNGYIRCDIPPNGDDTAPDLVHVDSYNCFPADCRGKLKIGDWGNIKMQRGPSGIWWQFFKD